MITKQFICANCQKTFKRTTSIAEFKKAAKRYNNVCCSKRCAMLLAHSNTKHKYKGIIKRKDNRSFIRVWNHPYANINSQVPRARLLAEIALNRFIQPGYDVHHLNADASDDRLENLLILSQFDHKHLHTMHRKRRLNGTFLAIES